MALRLSPFPNGCIAGVHAIGWALIVPCFWFLDRLIAVCKSTTLERTKRREQECYLHPLRVFFGSIIFFILFLVAAPLALLGFLIWAPLQGCRRPFSYHIETLLPLERVTRHSFEEGKATFGFATANLCLLPDSLARFNNLGHTQSRAATIGKCVAQGVSRPHIRIFIDSPSSCGTPSASSSLCRTTNAANYGTTDKQTKPAVNDTSVSVDGEVPAANSNSHVVYVPCDDAVEPPMEMGPLNATDAANTNQKSTQHGDAGDQSAPRVQRSSLGPGERDGVPWEVSSLFPANIDLLCLEEVFDKRAAQKLRDALGPVFGHVLYDVGVYACQPRCCSSFKFFNSGLFLASRFPVLEAQFHCFPNSRGEDALAAKGEGKIRFEQLNMVTVWIDEFQTSHTQPDEVVVFDVLCGDFNFDNCSPGITLETEELRKQYISPPVPAAGIPLVYPLPDEPWVGRRIDYILYRQNSIAKHCTTSAYWVVPQRQCSEMLSVSKRRGDEFQESSNIEEKVDDDTGLLGNTSFDIDVVVSLLRQENAVDICVIKVPEEINYADYFIVVTGRMVLHLMLPETREVYELEKLWSLGSFDEQLMSIPVEKLPEDFIYGLEDTK
ncbi:hypothetical protein NHX12_001588 [Muraenolepis orangiensis]|uniref:sphingomyelin phosphodiesterase n=1 Tax=Muraenolepis orangiensis TaxID=630683 RepID=A0A9Q0IGQ1_9TELE|nr:hypothetical protein NHX12_001588 [Muraenolepis orangiensis]